MGFISLIVFLVSSFYSIAAWIFTFKSVVRKGEGYLERALKCHLVAFITFIAFVIMVPAPSDSPAESSGSDVKEELVEEVDAEPEEKAIEEVKEEKPEEKEETVKEEEKVEKPKDEPKDEVVHTGKPGKTTRTLDLSSVNVPEDAMYVVVNNNIPFFSNEDITNLTPYESYGELDHLGRVTETNALLTVDLMPAEQRGDISSVRPTGWEQENYDVVSGGWLYNRSHLIGFQLTGENANRNNLMTGTRAFNVDGMLSFENFVANYIEKTENSVRYRVTPHFEGDNLLARGLLMEGFSIEDNGEGVQFNVYVANKQPNVKIDYRTGKSEVIGGTTNEPKPETKPAPEPKPEPVVEPTENDVEEVYYKNCTEAREAGATPVYLGDPGYGTHLDRSGNGIGCQNG